MSHKPPDKIGMEKCPCNQPGCNSYLLTGITSTDSKIPKHEAEEIVYRYNTQPIFKLAYRDALVLIEMAMDLITALRSLK